MSIGLFTLTSCEKNTTIPTSYDNAQAQTRTVEQVRFTNLEVDGCCMKILVRTNINVTANIPIHTIYIKNAQGHQIAEVRHGGQFGGLWFQDNDPEFSNYWEFSYCFPAGGVYTLEVGITGSPSGLASAIGPLPTQITVNITECKNPVPCVQYICLEDYFGAFGCSDGIEVVINGNLQTILFPGGPITNAVAGINQIIAAMQSIANSLGLTYSTNYQGGNVRKCNKGGSPTFGHFFINSPIIIKRLLGSENCENPQSPNAGLDDVLFEPCN